MSSNIDLGRGGVGDWSHGGAGKGDTDPSSEDKYVIEVLIGGGGVGEVYLVTDRDLRREVAVKLLRRKLGESDDARLQFVAEAQATSQLEHPGIPPVHDIGKAKDGRPFFTMKLIRGRTLREIVHDLLLNRAEVKREYTVHRLVTILERIAEALHFAHERGVIHCDLKPANIMLGAFGEVHVMDWGLARIKGEDEGIEGRVETVLAEFGLKPEPGSIQGTPQYMSPEQMRGEVDSIDRRTDVYGLGALLYEVLALRPPIDATDQELFQKVPKGEIVPVDTRNPRQKIPEALAAITRKAMAPNPEERFQTAREMAIELRVWLDGTSERERRHREAESLVALGREALDRFERTRADVANAEAAADQEAGRHLPWQPVTEKRSVLEARARVGELSREAALAFAETTYYLNAALTQEADNPAARTALANLWKGRLEDAERRDDKIEAAHALTLVRRYDDGSLAEYLAGEGALTVESDPPGAEVSLFRFVERDGVLVADEERDLGKTPVAVGSLEMGSYLCILRKAGFLDVRYPVLISRNSHSLGRVRLRTGAEVGEGFVHVPAGEFIFGEGKGTRTATLPDFAIAKYPVTFGEYAAFLETLGEAEVRERMPRTRGTGPFLERDRNGKFVVVPAAVVGGARERCLEEYGEGFEMKLPVVGVSWHDAEAYCRWKSETSGLACRLPTEEEREKGARGVDGRRYAWGNLEDASLGKCRESRDEAPQSEPVGAFPTSESVYGMGDASGGVWDWTDSWADEQRSLRVIRGGSWSNSSAVMRTAIRYRRAPGIRNGYVGIRCARDL